MRKKLDGLRIPSNYFAETRGGTSQVLEQILCFTRTSRAEAVAEPLSRQHHHRYVLIVPWEESGEVQVDARPFFLRPTQALLIFPFQFHHRFRFSRRFVLWQYITFEAPASSAASLEELRRHPARLLATADLRLLSGFMEAWERAGAGDDELGHWLGLFLTRMRAAPWPRRQTRTMEEPLAKGRGSLLTRINAYCMDQLQDGFRIKEIASFLAISESHLRTRFRMETSLSLGQHVRRLRLQKAMGLLLQTQFSVTQISEKCGFDSIFAFSRSFHRFSGMSARSYRNRFTRRRAAGDLSLDQSR